MNITEIILLIIFTVSVIINLLFYSFFVFKVLRYKKPIREISHNHPVSVIIAARNEAENLKKNLPYLLEQEYTQFEVVIANDYSYDNTVEIVKDFQRTYNNLKLVNNENLQGKKHALTTAIHASKYDFLLFTDADCHPSSNHWIELMSESLRKEIQIVLGLGMYGISNEFCNKFVRYDTQLIALNYTTASFTGHSYMGVGRNLAYTKETWEMNNGFASHNAIASGDDDLFVAESSTINNTAVCLEKDSITISESPTSLTGYLKMKARHLSTSPRYSIIALLFSSGEWLSRVLIYISFILLINTDTFVYLLFALLIRLLYITTTIRLFSIKINNKISIPYIIIFDIFAPVFYGILVIYKLLIHNKKQW